MPLLCADSSASLLALILKLQRYLVYHCPCWNTVSSVLMVQLG